MILTVSLFFLMSCSLLEVDGAKMKNRRLVKLCGVEIYAMHEFCCKNGCNQNGKKETELLQGLTLN